MKLLSGEKKQGYVAEYCITCRDVTEHALATGLVPETKMGYGIVRCSQCCIRCEADVSSYKSVDDKPGAPVLDLIRRTNPRLIAKAFDRACYDHELVTGISPPDIRAEAMREPFLCANYLLYTNPAFVHPAMAGVIFGGFIGAVVLGVIVPQAPQLQLKMGVPAGLIKFIAFMVPFSIGIAAGVLLRRKDLRAKGVAAMHVIARGLRSLKPTDQELEQVVKMLRLANRVPAWVTVPRLQAQISQLPDVSFRNMTFEEMRSQMIAMHEEHKARSENFARTGETEDIVAP